MPCFPKDTPEGKALIEALGEFEATRKWMENNFTIPAPEEPVSDLNAPEQPQEDKRRLVTKVPDSQLAKFKKEIGYKKEISDSRKISTLEKIEKYNKKNNTRYYIPYSPLGQSDLWTAGDIIDNTPIIEEKPAPKTSPGKQQSLEFYREDPQEKAAREELLNSPRAEDGLLNQLPFSLDTTSLKLARGTEILKKLCNILSDNFNTPYVFINKERALDIAPDWKGEPGFYDPSTGTVYFIEGQLTPLIALHEFAHPFLDAIEAKNPGLLKNLHGQLENSSEGKGIIDQVKTLYPDRDEAYKVKEALVRSLSLKAYNTRNSIEESSAFKKLIDKILYHIKQLLRKVFHPRRISIENLKTDTSLDDLAKMLEGEKFNIETEKVNEEVAFSRFQDVEKDIQLLDNRVNAIADEMRAIAVKNLKNPLPDEEKDKVVEQLSKGKDYQLGNIVSVLSEVTGPKAQKIRDLKGEPELLVRKGKAIVRGLESLLYLTRKIKEDMNLLNTTTPSKGDIIRIDWLTHMMGNWKSYLEDLNNKVSDLPEDSYIRKNLINVARTQISDIESLYQPVMKKGMQAYLGVVLEPIQENIEQNYKKDLEQATKRNAPQKTIDRINNKYNKEKITLEMLKADLDGTSIDAGMFNTFVESWMHSSDLVAGAWHRVIADNKRAGQTNALQKFDGFLKKVIPMIKKAGFDPKNLSAFANKFLQKENILRREGDEYKDSSVLRFINAHTGWDYENQKRRAELYKLEEEAEKTGDWNTYLSASKAFREFKRSYAWTKYLPEVYQADKVFDESQYGEEARMLNQDIQDRIDDIEDNIVPGDEEARLDAGPELEALYKEKRQLRSLKDLDNNYKTGKDLEIAKLLQQYYSLSGKYREWKLNSTLFQRAYTKMYQQLIDQGLTEDNAEFQEKLDRWKDQNMNIRVKKEFYDITGPIYEAINKIYSSVSKPSPEGLELAKSFKEVSDLLYGYRDSDGQPIGPDMSPKTLEKLKTLQERIEVLRKEVNTGLTQTEQEELNSYFDILRSKDQLDYEEQQRFDELIGRPDKSGLSRIQKVALNKYFQQLSDLEGKKPTEYYIEVFNNYLSRLPEDLKDRLAAINKTAYIDENSANFVINLPKHVLLDILQSVPGFEDWFRANHIKVSRWNKTMGKASPEWQRISAWTIKRPLDPKYLETTKVVDHNDNIIELQGVPNTRFQRYKVKDQYQTGWNPQTKEVELIPGYHYDARANKENGINTMPLPKPVSEGAPDDHFFNKEYLNMKTQDPERFAILETIKQEYYQWQEDAKDRQVRLGNDLPRFYKHGLESFQTPGYLGKQGSRIVQFARNTWEALAEKKSDINYTHDYMEDIRNASLDAITTDPSIPVNGIFHIPSEDTSLDIFHSMGKYLMSLEQYKKLTDIQPFGRTLENILNDPGDYSDAVSRVNIKSRSNTGILEGKIGKSNRAAAVHNMNERDIYGHYRTGLFSDNLVINKAMNLALRGASWSTLALNIPTAATIALTQHLQNWIEGMGGKYFNPSTWAWGTAHAGKVMADISFEVNKVGNHSLNVQLVNLFNVLQGKTEEKIGSNIARTLGRDIVSLSWVYSPLKWMESEASISQFMAMMKFKKIPQTINGVTKQISYIDAWIQKDGKPVLKEGIDESWGPDGKDFMAYLHTIDKLQRDLIGSFDSFGQPEVYRYALGRMFLFLRKHIVGMIANRWSGERYDISKMERSTGYYWKALKSFQNAYVEGGLKYFLHMTDEEKYAWKKVVSEVGFLVLTTMAFGLVFGWNNGDEDRYKKLRAKSGPLPLPGIVPTEDEYNTGGYLANHALLQMMKVRAWDEMWLPIPGMGLKDYANLTTMVPIAMGPTVQAYTKTASDFMRWVEEDPASYYQKPAGPALWQQEGSPKFENDLIKILGFSGTTVQPVEGIRKEQLRENVPQTR